VIGLTSVFNVARVPDLVPAIRAQAQVTGGDAPAQAAGGPLAAGLITVGALASFAMGGNDVANATGSLVGTGTFSALSAGLIAAAARGRHTVHAAAPYGVLRGWLLGPGAAIALGYAISWPAAATTAGTQTLLAGG
jgi:hypothetical protein